MEKQESRIHQLLKIFPHKDRVLILTHNNPDPDSLASALALKFIIHKLLNLPVVMAYGGIIGRAENRAMVKYLRLDLVHANSLIFSHYRSIILVDTQPQTGNNALPKNITPDVVIDHHPLRRATRKARFYDIRPETGATCTVIAQYLVESGLEINGRMATALFYGIKSDTLDFGRQVTEADHRIFITLYPKVIPKLLARIEYPKLPKSYFQEFNRALEEAVIHKDTVVSDLGVVKNPDMIAEMADSFLKIEGVSSTLCLGQFEEDLFFSLRTSRPSPKAGLISTRVARHIGSAGGHGMSAGGKIPLNSLGQEGREQLKEKVIYRFLKTLKRLDVKGTRLIES